YALNPGESDATSSDAAERDRDSATLRWLATETGGDAVLDAGALAAGMRRMMGDLDAYYAITYQPRLADGRFHPVEVRTNRPEAQVRARPGYWSPLGAEWTSLLATTGRPAAPRRALHRSPIIDAWTGVTPGAN